MTLIVIDTDSDTDNDNDSDNDIDNDNGTDSIIMITIMILIMILIPKMTVIVILIMILMMTLHFQWFERSITYLCAMIISKASKMPRKQRASIKALRLPHMHMNLHWLDINLA